MINDLTFNAPITIAADKSLFLLLLLLVVLVVVVVVVVVVAVVVVVVVVVVVEAVVVVAAVAVELVDNIMTILFRLRMRRLILILAGHKFPKVLLLTLRLLSSWVMKIY